MMMGVNRRLLDLERDAQIITRSDDESQGENDVGVNPSGSYSTRISTNADANETAAMAYVLFLCVACVGIIIAALFS